MPDARDADDLPEPPEPTRLPAVVTPVHSGGGLPEVGVVTCLRVYGINAELTLSPEQRSFTLGGAASPAVDLTIDGDGVSRLHARLERKGPKLRVIDQGSTNGTFLNGHLDPDFEIAPGQTFEVTRKVKLLALDEQLRLLRRSLHWAIGLRAHAAVDEAIELIVTNRPLLLVGEPWCEQVALAEQIYQRSPFRAKGWATAPRTLGTREEQDAILDAVEGGTLYLDLMGSTSPLPNHFVARLFSGSIRPIVTATSEDRARALIDRYARQCEVVTLPPLSARRDDVPRLLDALILQAGKGDGKQEPARLAALGEDNVDGLKAYGWPRNFRDLRRAVPRLHALLTNRVGNRIVLRAAARALGLRSVTSLIEALATINVRIQRNDDEADEIDDVYPGAGALDDRDEPVTPLDPPR